MDTGSLLQYLFFLVVLTAFLLATCFSLHRKPLPPGPMGFPLIGNLNMMSQQTHRDLARLAQKYGNLFYMRIGFLHMITVSSPEAAREVLHVQDKIFSNKPATITARYLTYGRADLAFAHYGPVWRQLRKLSVMNLFSKKQVEMWRSVCYEMDYLIRVIGGSIGSPVNVGELVQSLNKRFIYRAAFGSDSNKEEEEEFLALVHDLARLFTEFNWADFIPLLGWASPNWVSGRAMEARKALDKFIDRIIDDHVVDKKGKRNDLVGELLQFYSEGEGNVVESDGLHGHGDIRLTRENVKAIILDIMFGGTEAVASLIEWAMAELMKWPETMKRAQQELTEVVGLHRRVEVADVEKLSYFHCIIKETLRLHPPIPLLLHETAKETTMMGYRVPAKTRVVVNVWAIGRDKDSWPDPESFKPERFSEKGVPDFKGGDFEFIPFGSGRRSCPAMNLGLHLLQMTLANLIQCFEWELPNGMNLNGLDMDERFGLTLPRASRLIVVPKHRLIFPTY